MNEEIEFLYNTRSRTRSLDPNHQRKLAAAFSRDIEDDIEVDEENPFDDSDDGDYCPDDDASDVESELVVEPGEFIESEEENDQEGKPQATSNEFYIGKDGTKWAKAEPLSTGRLPQHNVMHFRAGPKERSSSPLDVFKKFLSTNISFIIITETNRNAQNAVQKWNSSHPDRTPRVWNDLTQIELDAYIGLLIAAGASHNNMQKTEFLWRTDNLPIFRAAMSHKRFAALTRYIRFDDSRTRTFRQQTDKAAPIRDIWNLLNENLARNYEPHANVTVDEQLFPYRGRTKFTQYIPSKPAKYGIKIWWACDAKTKYPLQGILYTGREAGEEREINQGENVLMKLARRYAKSGRTIVADNFFTTLEGAKKLASMGLAFVGTIRSNKRCIPAEMKKNKSRPVLSSNFGFHDKVSICSYVPKKNKAVILLSTVHYSKNCVGDSKKPEAIMYYNANKSDVDTMDQMVTHFTTKRPTKRWPLALFYNLIDVMALAAFCICKEIDKLDKSSARREFLHELAFVLAKSNIEDRMANSNVNRQFATRSAFDALFGKQSQNLATVAATQSGPLTLTVKQNCHICHSNDKQRRKTRFFCKKCENPVCLQHCKVEHICFSCVDQ